MTDYLTRLAQRALGQLPVAHPLITLSFATIPERIKYPAETSFSEKVIPEYPEVTHGIREPERAQTFSMPQAIVRKPENRDFSLEPGEQLLNDNEDVPSMQDDRGRYDIRDQKIENENPILSDIISEPAHIEMRGNGDNIDKNISKIIVSERIRRKQDAAELIKGGNDGLVIDGERGQEQIKMEHEIQMQGGYPVSEIETDKIADISSSTQAAMNVIDRRNSARMVQDRFDNPQKGERTLVKFEENMPETSNLRTNTDHSTSSGVFQQSENLTSYPSGLQNREKGKSEKIKKSGFENHICPVIARMGDKRNQVVSDINVIALQQPDIKVTIGRVEVRAVSSPEVPRSVPVRKIPVLSLDEYLKQHKR